MYSEYFTQTKKHAAESQPNKQEDALSVRLPFVLSAFWRIVVRNADPKLYEDLSVLIIEDS